MALQSFTMKLPGPSTTFFTLMLYPKMGPSLLPIVLCSIYYPTLPKRLPVASTDVDTANARPVSGGVIEGGVLGPVTFLGI